MNSSPVLLVGVLSLASQIALSAQAADTVHLVVGPQAPALERHASEEISEHLKTLFGAKANVVEESPPTATALIYIGSPESNPALKKVLGDQWPTLSPQGQWLRSVKVDGKSALVVAGGSPVATFWAASELGHRWGVRTQLFGNLQPADKPTFSLDGFDAVLEPSFPIRAWSLMDATPVGPAAWGLAEQKKFLRQLARLKFNRIVLDVEPWQPFVAWESGGVKKTSAELWPGGAIKVDGDTAGRSAFKGQAWFDNPDLMGKKEPAERIAAGKTLLTGLIDEAHAWGMTVALSTAPFEFPKEFASQLPDAKPSPSEPQLAVIPGDEAALASEPVLKLARAQIRAYLETYPKVDLFQLRAPSDWNGDASASWQRLQDTGTIAKDASLEALIESAEKRKAPLTGDVAGTNLAAQVAAIPAVRHLVEHPTLWQIGKSTCPVELARLDPALASVGLRITPAGVGTLFAPSDDKAPDAGKKPGKPIAAARLTAALDWSDVHLGVLPGFSSRRTEAAVKSLRERKWGGFTVYAPLSSGVGPTALFLSRAACDGSVTFESSLTDLVDHVSGEGVAGRVVKAFSLIEEAADVQDYGSLPFAAADEKVFERHAENQPAPPRWAQLRDAALNAMNEMYRANTRAREGAREFTLYYARRFESAFDTLNALEAMRLAKIAEGGADQEKQIEQLEKAIESIYGSLNAYAAIARDPSDRGVIALLNRSAYRLLQKQLEDAEK